MSRRIGTARQLLQSSTLHKFITTMTKTGPRRFAPLRQDIEHHEDLPKLQGVIFDVDGTLWLHTPFLSRPTILRLNTSEASYYLLTYALKSPCLQSQIMKPENLPQNYMFTQMRSILGIPKSVDILTHISSLPSVSEQEAAMKSIRAIEREAMSSQVAQPGLLALMTYLQSRGVRKGICTRNFEQPVAHLLGKFLSGLDFAPIVTRDFRPPKPDPAGLLFIARSWGLVRPLPPGGPGSGPRDGDGNRGEDEKTRALLAAAKEGSEAEREGARGPATTTPNPQDCERNGTAGNRAEEVGDASSLIMVGDSIDDMTAGRHAGAATVLLVNKDNAHLADHPHTDLVITSLDELVEVLENGFVGRETPATSM
ncbi:HAD-like protein [Xylariaceae sp. FL0594]|nr:HAD-like protein [Xylariaceae sp. FL0594]